MADVHKKKDYYKDITVSDKRVGVDFEDCHFNWNFNSQQMTIVNDSIQTDIEYSFDGVNVAGRLRHGTDPDVGGESYTYTGDTRREIWLRIAEDEAEEEDLPYRLFVHRGLSPGW